VKKAFTLIEVLVVASLMGVLLTLMLLVLLPLFRQYNQTNAEVQIYQSAAVAMERVAESIRVSNIRGLTFLDNPNAQVKAALLAQPLNPLNGMTQATWAPAITVLSWTSAGNLTWSQWTSPALVQSNSAVPYHPSAAEINQALTPPNATDLAGGVTRFTIVGLDPLVRSLPLSITLTLRSVRGQVCNLQEKISPLTLDSQ
jgi:prepilin-type N-terminal cleavage/methylation domain-containing protein